VRLCLDEHYALQIAVELRKRAHEVTAVSERAELRGLDDRPLLAMLQAERSALLTENVSDFAPIVQELAARIEDHWGVVFSSPVSMPRGAGTIALFVQALDRLLRERPAEDGLLNQVWWLQPS
jgi:NAD(P)H-dependent FMN reductase